LKTSYGPSATISGLEKAVQEVSLMEKTPEEFFLADGVLDLYEEYLNARTERNEENNSFRSEQTVQSVTSALTNLKAKLAKEEEENSD
jgi:hypothetical protein